MLRSLDLFFFHDDEMQRLDAYQHVENPSDGAIDGIAGSGAHLVAAISNFRGDSYLWKDIQSFSHLCDRQFHLEDEDPDNPLLYGTAHLESGLSRSCTMTLKPMLSALHIRTLSCDFSGKPYEGQLLINPSFFVNNSASLSYPLDAERVREESFINPGYLDLKAVEKLKHPEMLYRQLGHDVGWEREEIGITLYTYPNPITEESLGRPFTRLVIEGTLDGKTCYYPINIPGLGPNRKYTMDITLTRMGSPDPDIPVDTGTAIIEIDTKPWAEFEQYSVRF